MFQRQFLNRSNRRSVEAMKIDSVLYEYIKVTKYLMCIIGQWPYQTLLEKMLVAIVFVPIIMGQLIFQGGGMICGLLNGDIDAFMEAFAPFIISLMCIAKYMNFIWNVKQMKNLTDTILEDWEIYSKSEEECNILCRNYALGKKITVNYTVALYGFMAPFLLVPTLLDAADTLGFYNLSGERPLVFNVEHFVNVESYYYPLLIHSYFGTLAYITIVVGVDSMIVMYVHHECGLCEILGKRLKNFTEADSMDIDLYPKKSEDQSYQYARNCIILHNHILQYGKTIEDANTLSYFFQLGFNLLGISFTQFQAVANLSAPNKSIRFCCFTFTLLSTLLLESLPGQTLTDHTERIYEYTTSGKWYLSSMNARKLIHIMLSKSVKPLKLTAGRFYILNLESYSAVVKTSFSYCMVLCSFQ